ncbi:four-carbon acid sugar kinase family protein [Sporomusa aerivorans]|uniref:four-carbon acid sugar kinase family protein n=1 Tax=Sporomusa aerivorans TaxID=204936 RepID=UPI00352A9C51
MNEKTGTLIVIADDLTGANDTGVQFARQGLKTDVLLEGAVLDKAGDASVVVMDTNSRASSAGDAYQKVQAVARQAQQTGFRYFYKKLDSTLRGNVGVELQAILDLKIQDFAFVMPALPKTGRTTIGGHHLLHGVPVSATEIAKDPKCPVYETVLPELLRQQSSLPVGHIGFAELTRGEAAVASALQKLLSAGCKIISCDGWLDEHFVVAARAVNSVSANVLWSGSAGLAEFLPELFGWNQKIKPNKPVVVIAGSVSAVTRAQVTQLINQGFEWLEIEVANYLPWQPHELTPYLSAATSHLSQGKNLVITSGYQPDAIDKAMAVGAKLGMSGVEVSNTIAEILGWLGSTLLAQQEVAGAVLTGGDTAVSVCRALGVTGIRVIEEVAPAIPLGEMKTATGKTLRVVTKAGAFGDADALLKATHKIRAV